MDIFVGYRWYDRRDLAVSFPFGHGLAYTTFDYAGARAGADPEGVSVTVRVTDSGARSGRAVVQVHTGLVSSAVLRPPRELGGLAIAELEHGAARDVTVWIPRRIRPLERAGRALGRRGR